MAPSPAAWNETYSAGREIPEMAGRDCWETGIGCNRKKKLRLIFSLHVIVSRLHCIWSAQPFIDSDLLPQVDMLLSLPEQNGKTNQEWSNNLFLGLFFLYPSLRFKSYPCAKYICISSPPNTWWNRLPDVWSIWRRHSTWGAMGEGEESEQLCESNSYVLVFHSLYILRLDALTEQ